MIEFTEYIRNISANKSKHTVRGYKKNIEKLLSHFSIVDLKGFESLTVNQYRLFLNSLLEKGLQESSVNCLIRDVDAFCSYLISDNISMNEKLAFHKIKFGKSHFMKVKTKLKDTLTDEEVQLVIDSENDIQYKFMFAFLLHTGIRRNELTNILISDVDEMERSVIIHGKGGTVEKTFMNGVVFSLYKKALADRKSDSPYLFYAKGHKGQLSGDAVYKRVLAKIEELGIDKKITTHRLRATVITNIISKYGLGIAMKVARHKNMATTSIYDNTRMEQVKSVLG